MRTLVDIPEEDIRWLDTNAVEQGKSRAALVREAVSIFRAQTVPADDKSWIDRGFGIWQDRTDIGDGLEYQRRIRAEWTRPWDDDYEAVKAEYPELFDESDDRERARFLAMHGEQQRKAS